MPPSILVIEDNPDISRVIEYELQDAGYHVLTAANGMGGLTAAREQQPNLVILDLGLPDLNGAEVARRLRKTGDVPIIVLTALDDIPSKVDLLGAGADDYLTKPFDPPELLARVQVQLRHQARQDLVTVGPLKVSRQQRQCFYDGREVPLSHKEFELMSLLAQQPGRVYRREEIAQHLWREEKGTNPSVVDVHLGNMRGKLRDVGGHGVIRTVRGVGFALRT